MNLGTTRHFLTSAAIAALLCFVWSASAQAQPLSRLEHRGQALLTKFCAECHAVGASEPSPHFRAPPLRMIAQRYDIDVLVELLQEGFTAPHPEMPRFKFSSQDARAVQAYLYAIQK